MLKEIIIAVQSYFDAHQFIKEHKLWKWILIPGLIYTFLFITGISFFWASSNSAIEWMLINSGAKSWLEKMQDTWLSFFFIVGQIFIRLLLLFFYFSLFKFIFLIIGSPVFAYLSEKTESIIENKTFNLDYAQLLKDIIRGSKIAFRNFSWQTVYVLALFLFSFIPIIGWAAPMFVLFIDCFYLGFSMLDYSMERNKLSVANSVDVISHHRGLAIGNGVVFYLFHALPFIGWVFAPSYAVIAATLSLHRAKKNKIISL